MSYLNRRLKALTVPKDFRTVILTHCSGHKDGNFMIAVRRRYDVCFINIDICREIVIRRSGQMTV